MAVADCSRNAATWAANSRWRAIPHPAISDASTNATQSLHIHRAPHSTFRRYPLRKQQIPSGPLAEGLSLRRSIQVSQELYQLARNRHLARLTGVIEAPRLRRFANGRACSVPGCVRPPFARPKGAPVRSRQRPRAGEEAQEEGVGHVTV